MVPHTQKGVDVITRQPRDYLLHIYNITMSESCGYGQKFLFKYLPLSKPCDIQNCSNYEGILPANVYWLLRNFSPSSRFLLGPSFCTHIWLSLARLATERKTQYSTLFNQRYLTFHYNIDISCSINYIHIDMSFYLQLIHRNTLLNNKLHINFSDCCHVLHAKISSVYKLSRTTVDISGLSDTDCILSYI